MLHNESDDGANATTGTSVDRRPDDGVALFAGRAVRADRAAPLVRRTWLAAPIRGAQDRRLAR